MRVDYFYGVGFWEREGGAGAGGEGLGGGHFWGKNGDGGLRMERGREREGWVYMGRDWGEWVDSVIMLGFVIFVEVGMPLAYFGLDFSR